jgi:hypothetical protein
MSTLQVAPFLSFDISAAFVFYEQHLAASDSELAALMLLDGTWLVLDGAALKTRGGAEGGGA